MQNHIFIFTELYIFTIVGELPLKIYSSKDIHNDMNRFEAHKHRRKREN